MAGRSYNVNPNLAWYTEISARKRVPPRCPFASVSRCPRYYQSLSLLGEAGSTKIDPTEDKKLLANWKNSDLWPVTAEQSTSLFGPKGDPHHFWHFCPEVAFDRFGLFAENLSYYPDELDRDLAHAQLGKEHAAADDPRWVWASVSPRHYSECPLYSPLLHDSSKPRPDRGAGEQHPEGIFEIKPSSHGITLNLGELWRRLVAWWRRERR
jgi:hypothetical protein